MNYRQTFQTFGILIAVTVIATAAAATTIVSSGASSINYAQAQTAIKVSIVPSSSTLGDKAFSPNPVNIKVGDTVTWTNNDNQAHTVISGTGPSDPNMGKDFDSSPGFKSLLAPGKTFSHKFTKSGEIPYFCGLHPPPSMLGKVVVS